MHRHGLGHRVRHRRVHGMSGSAMDRGRPTTSRSSPGGGATPPRPRTWCARPTPTSWPIAAKAAGPRGAVARGLGRAYGDSAMNAGGLVISSTGVSGLLELDHPRGTARVLAGTSLDSLLREIVPQGWFVPVTPGTRYITVGGAIAADVHGKDHHATGSFGAHVQSLVLGLPDGTRRTLTPDEDADEFWATCGGMGLTGTVVEATDSPARHRDEPAPGRHRPGARSRHAPHAVVGRRSPTPLLGRLGGFPGSGALAGPVGADPRRLRPARRAPRGWSPPSPASRA